MSMSRALTELRPLSSALTRKPTDPGLGGGWTPALWFLASEQGAWYDPSDMSTMFQDSAGTTPVTAVEQPVGKMLDKSGNGNHASQPTTAARPKLSARKNLLTYSEDLSNAAWLKSGATVTANGANDSTGAATLDKIVESATTAAHFAYQNGLPASAQVTVRFEARAGGRDFLGVMNSVPNLGAVFNLSAGTATNYGGGTSSTITALGGGLYACTVTISSTGATLIFCVQNAAGSLFSSYLGDGSSGVFVGRVQMEYGATATAYQSITTATDYDTVGFPHYLKFDGVDDFLSTGSIDFTGTDKMTVVAGARKLASADGIIAELSAQYNLNNGSFNLQSRADPTGVTLFVRGSTRTVAVSGSAFTTNTPAVVTATSKIAADWLHTVSVNAGAPAIASTNIGTGNFGNYPLYIGRRGGTSLPFNGHLYQLVVRGAATADLAPIEAFIADKTGVTL